MAWLTSGLMAIAGTSNTTPQPLWGSWVTAVVSGNFSVPSSSPLTLTLGSANASGGNDATQLFTRVCGQYVWLIDPGVAFAGANAEKVFLQSVSGNNVVLGPKPLRSASSPGGGTINPVTEFGHVAGSIGTGTYILPAFDLNNLAVTYEDGGTGPWLYIGNSISMTTTTYRIWKLANTTAGSQPAYYSSAMFSPGNPFNASETWALGINGDKWSVSTNVA